MDNNSDQTIKEDLKLLKTDSALRRLNLASIISICIGTFHLIADTLTQGPFTHKEEKLTIIISHGSMIYLNLWINSNKSYAGLVSFVFGEFINCILINHSYVKYKDYSIFWTQLAPFVSMYYQSYLIESKRGMVLLSLKHTATWVGFGYYYSNFTVNDFPLVVATVSGIFVLMCSCCYFEHLQDLDLCKSKEVVKESYKKLNSLVESFPKFICVLTADKKVVFCNTLLKNLVTENDSVQGYLSKAIYYERYLDSNSSFGIFEDIMNTFQLDLSSKVVYGISEYKGVFVEWEGKLDNWDNKLVIILIGRDIGEMLKLKKESAENSYKSNLLRTVSHELRTPTNSMLLMSQYLLDSADLSRVAKERVEIIASSCNYQLCLINDLLDYSQIMAGCLKIVKVSFNLPQLLKECLKILEIDLNLSNISSEIVSKSLIPEDITTDPYRLKQILINLLSNSRKFTKKGKISLIVSLKGKFLNIACKDTGFGIEEKEKNKLFKVFGKTDDDKNNPQGTGLGLYISNMLVRELGGDGIHLKSVLGKGSKFSFMIPVHCDTKLSCKVAKEHSNVTLPRPEFKFKGKAKVLIVDDTYFNVLALLQILQPEGILCSYALNGEEAVRMVKENEFDCVIMDCEMPVMDGLEATKEIKRMFGSGKIRKMPPIIGSTAHDCEDVRVECRNVGMNDVIVKPCPRGEIVGKVGQWIKAYKFM